MAPLIVVRGTDLAVGGYWRLAEHKPRPEWAELGLCPSDTMNFMLKWRESDVWRAAPSDRALLAVDESPDTRRVHVYIGTRLSLDRQEDRYRSHGFAFAWPDAAGPPTLGAMSRIAAHLLSILPAPVQDEGALYLDGIPVGPLSDADHRARWVRRLSFRVPEPDGEVLTLAAHRWEPVFDVTLSDLSIPERELALLDWVEHFQRENVGLTQEVAKLHGEVEEANTALAVAQSDLSNRERELAAARDELAEARNAFTKLREPRPKNKLSKEAAAGDGDPDWKWLPAMLGAMALGVAMGWAIAILTVVALRQGLGSHGAPAPPPPAPPLPHEERSTVAAPVPLPQLAPEPVPHQEEKSALEKEPTWSIARVVETQWDAAKCKWTDDPNRNTYKNTHPGHPKSGANNIYRGPITSLLENGKEMLQPGKEIMSCGVRATPAPAP